MSEGKGEEKSKKSYGNLEKNKIKINLFERFKSQSNKETKGDTIYSNYATSFTITDKKQEENTGLDSILQVLSYKNDNDLLKENDDFITTDQDVHILDNEQSIYKISLFLNNNNNIDYVLDVMNSVLMNNKLIRFNRLRECFGYEFKESIISNINQTTTKEKLETFNKNLLIRIIQNLELSFCAKTTELQTKTTSDLLKQLFELNKNKYKNKSILEHLKTTLDSVICMPEVEVDFVFKTLLNSNSISYNEYYKLKYYINSKYFLELQNSTEQTTQLKTIIDNFETEYSKIENVNIELQSTKETENFLKLNKLINNILLLQDFTIKDKSNKLDVYTLYMIYLTSYNNFKTIREDLISKLDINYNILTKLPYNILENVNKYLKTTINTEIEKQEYNIQNQTNTPKEPDKIVLISSIKQLSQYATDTEYKLIGNSNKKDCCNDNLLEQLSVDTLQQINNNLLVYKYMEEEYYKFLVNENDTCLNVYNALYDSYNELKKSKVDFKRII